MIDLTSLSDFELVRLYQSGNDRSIAELFKRKFAVLFGNSYKVLRDEEASKDCIQKILVHFIEKAVTERAAYFRDGIDSFLARCALNEAISYSRSVKGRSMRDRMYTTINFGKTDVENYFYESQERELLERIETLHTVINTLSGMEKLFVELWLENPRNKQKISQELNLSDSAYRTLQQKVLRTLKRKLIRKSE